MRVCGGSLSIWRYDRLALAPFAGAFGVVDNRRDGETAASTGVAVGFLLGRNGCARQHRHRQDARRADERSVFRHSISPLQTAGYAFG